MNRTKSTLDLARSTSNQGRESQFAIPPSLVSPESGELNRKNWTCLTDDVKIFFLLIPVVLLHFLTCLLIALLFAGLLSALPQVPKETGTACKTWDGPSGSCSSSAGSDMNLELVQRSYTAPDRTGIRIYYSPPAIRRTELQRRSPGPRERETSQNGTSPASDTPQSSSSFSSYEQWLSSLSKQHRELLESRSGCVSAGSIPLAGLVVNDGGSANSLVDAVAPSPSPFHALEMGEISANLSDDMKEMTNCVRQAIRSSSLERKSSKESGSQVDLVFFFSFFSFFSSRWLLPPANHLPPLNPALSKHQLTSLHP